MHKESLGTRLRLERFKKNMTQAQICRELGMKVSTLSQIENDKGKHFDSTIKRLLDHYKMNPEI